MPDGATRPALSREDAESEVRRTERLLARMDSTLERARGLLALSQSFIERGGYAEASNLAVLARLEISKFSPGPAEDVPSPEKKTITYSLRKVNDPGERLWVRESERAMFIHALRSLADAMELHMNLQERHPGTMTVTLATPEGGDIARLVRTSRTSGEETAISIDVHCPDRETFMLVFIYLKEKFAGISEYLLGPKAEPHYPPAEKGELLAYLKDRALADVEEALVLHADGRLMCHISSTQVADIDYDILGSMILALQSFVRDSFRKDFDELGFSGKRILLVSGENLKVAFVMKGEIKDRFRKRIAHAVRSIESELGTKITHWKGDMSVAYEIHPYLETFVPGGRLLLRGVE